ncbi:MAG: TRM11 family SAM-dependent methyltransferase [Thermoplasmata archaeon]
MIRAYIEPSGESPALARAESVAATEALGGRPATERLLEVPDLIEVDVPDLPSAGNLAQRLALARRALLLRSRSEEIGPYLEGEGRSGSTAAVRRFKRPSSGGDDAGVRAAGRSYTSGGGRIDLVRPDRRFWLARATDGTDVLLEEVASVDRRASAARRMPSLPFQRPVSLPPRYARAAANLARIRPGDRVVDPFVGTGALLAEAGLLGARLYGIDRDPEMVRGTLRNLAHLGVGAEELVVGDAGEVEFADRAAAFDAVLTDPPYGRASSTGGEGHAAVVERVLPRWAARVRPGGRLVVVVPGPTLDPGPGWRPVAAASIRVHRSLTREFRAYERDAVTTRSE